jgi:ribosomal protein S25
VSSPAAVSSSGGTQPGVGATTARFGSTTGKIGKPAKAKRRKDKPAAAATGVKKTRAPRAGNAARAKSLDEVAKIVTGSKGLSVSQIAKQSGLAKARLSALLKQLKDRGRVQMAGERRFARYAADKRTAQAASDGARGIGAPAAKKARKKGKR